MSADAAVDAAAAPAAATEPAPASAPQSPFSVVFEAGPLGLSLGDDRSIGKVVADSQAARGGVEVGDRLVRVNDASIVDLPPAEVLNAIKAAGRPMTLTFERVPPPPASAPAAAAPAASSTGGGGRPSLIAAVLGGAGIASSSALGAGGASSASAAAGGVGVVSAPAAKDVAKKAGAFMRGVLSTSAQVFSAVDKVIDRAIDDSTKRVAHAAKTTARDITATGKRASLQISASLAVTKGAGVDIRRLRARSGSSGSIALGDADAGFEGLHALQRLQQERVGVLRANNEAVMALADEVDVTLRDARAHTARLQGEYAALQAAAGALPAITADLRAACDRAAHLKELMTALEGKLTGAALAKVDREHAAWVAAAERSVDDHAKARDAQVTAARLRAQDVASRFVANTGGVADAIMAAMAASAAGGAGAPAAADAAAPEKQAADAAATPTKADEAAAQPAAAGGDAPTAPVASTASPAQSPQTWDATAATPASAAPSSAASMDASSPVAAGSTPPAAAAPAAPAADEKATTTPSAAEPAAAAAGASDLSTAATPPAAAAASEPPAVATGAAAAPAGAEPAAAAAAVAADSSSSAEEVAGAAAKGAADAKKGKGGKAGKKGGKDAPAAAAAAAGSTVAAADTEIDETTGKPLVRGQSVRVKDLAKLYDPSAKQ